jgi:S1-C subfamily serine protease
MIEKAKAFARAPFGSALAGGLVVALLGWAAIAAGLIESSSGDDASALPLTAAPVNAKESGDANTVAQIYRSEAPGVAFISARRASEAPSPLDFFGVPEGGGTATGSGFVIDAEGHILTNSHVVAGAEAIDVKLGSSDDTYDAEVVGRDPATDLALLKVDAPSSQLHPLPLGDSSKVRVGDPVVAIGNPFGLDQTATTGIVSALQRQIQAPNGFGISQVIQTDASINPGNSGGPLINAAGEVIGITSQIETGGGRGSVGIGFAIPSNTAREVVSQLQEDGEVDHAFLGISGTTITPDVADALNLPVDSGVLVEEATEGGPAAEAGIRGGHTPATIEGIGIRLGGDIITAIDGRDIASMDQVVNLVNSADPGDSLEVSVRRGDETKTFTVTLSDRPSSASALGR